MNSKWKISKPPLIVGIVAIAVLVVGFCICFAFYFIGTQNLATQQQWTSGKEQFDIAYEVAATDKDTPDKTLYVPKLADQLGKTVDEAVASVGQGARVISTAAVGSGNDKVTTETPVLITNESANVNSVAPTCVFGCNSKGKIVSASFSCAISVLGYRNLSFVDIINNEHLIEKTLKEAGADVANGTVVAPTDRSTYTKFASDGTTAISEAHTFSGYSENDYEWSATVTYDYTKSNQTGNLVDAVKSINIKVSL